jgi:hypothetical protein
MGRLVMDGGFRRIKRAAAPEPDARLALVEQFAATQPPVNPEPVPTDPADDPLVQQALEILSKPLDEGSQEAQEQPQEATGENGPEEPSEAADETPADENEDTVPDAPAEAAQPEKDYDPIAAVLG